jgi:GNAT superfamily N-acetyltransferase
MGAAVLITTMDNEHPDFYATVGPFLSRREIVKEQGAPIWDDDGKEWFVARLGRNVVGIAAIKDIPTADHVSLVSAYVMPEYRGRGVYTALLRARIETAVERGRAVRTTATEVSTHALRKAGLVAVSRRGKFTIMELRP